VFTRSDSGGGPIENAAGLVAAIEAAVRDGMDVINLSLGEPEIEPSRNVVTLAIDAAAAAGVVPVVAAGNEYGDVGAGSVSSPATSARAIAVAAVQTSGSPPVSVHADFSSVGPTPISLLLKPDVAAPGVAILSSVPDDGWASADGTSAASPHVAGAAALLGQRHPTWTVDEIKSALVQTGTDATDEDGGALGPQFQGGGVIALARADRPFLFAEPTGISLGLLARGSTSDGTVHLEDEATAPAWQVTETRAPGAAAEPTCTCRFRSRSPESSSTRWSSLREWHKGTCRGTSFYREDRMSGASRSSDGLLPLRWSATARFR
jgi:subtilisin family serine protease